MYARKVTFRIRLGMQQDYTQIFESQILPLLRKQKGFREAIWLCNPSSPEGIAISIWERKSDADEYNTRVYPEMLKSLATIIDGTPRIHSFESVSSSFHNIPSFV